MVFMDSEYLVNINVLFSLDIVEINIRDQYLIRLNQEP